MKRPDIAIALKETPEVYSATGAVLVSIPICGEKLALALSPEHAYAFAQAVAMAAGAAKADLESLAPGERA